MTSIFVRVTISATLIYGLTTGCASGNSPGKSVAAPAVTGEQLEDQPGKPIEVKLQEMVPGLLVTRSGGGISLQIRNASSFDNSNAPLFVVDEAPFEPGPGGVLTGIDPYSIASIQVLKGTEAGLYGIRGMNGVIVITTKRAPRRKG